MTPSFTECKMNTYYAIADATWKNLQESVKQWVEDNGGSAVIEQPVAIKVDREKILQSLKSTSVITEINCN